MERMNYAEFVNAAKEKYIDSYLIDGYFQTGAWCALTEGAKTGLPSKKNGP